jgi:hypothetical protein
VTGRARWSGGSSCHRLRRKIGKMWTLGYGYHEDRTPTSGYEPTREAAMEAFAKSWRRETARATARPSGMSEVRTRSHQ